MWQFTKWILSSFKTEGSLANVTTWMSLKDVMLSEISQSQKTKNTARLHLREASKIVKKSIGWKSPGVRERGKLEIVVRQYKVFPLNFPTPPKKKKIINFTEVKDAKQKLINNNKMHFLCSKTMAFKNKT